MTDGNDGFWIEQTPGVGDYQLIVAEGQQIEVAPGDLRTVDAIDLNYTQFFNDSGYYAYQVDFTDNTEAIFAFIPEPTPLSLLAVGGLALLRRRSPRA
jgi:MYXO-CTERM domain-containing protein